MTTMKVWQKHIGKNGAVRVEVPVPTTPKDGFLVKVLAAGVCHSDYGLLQTNTMPTPNWNEKYTLGHEGCGEIIDIGPEVTDPRFQKGTTIALLSVPGCQLPTCGDCSRGHPQLCKAAPCHGIGSDGFFAPYAAVRLASAAIVPAGVSPAEAAVATDACLTAYHAVHCTGKVKANETVLVFGLGGLGFNAVQMLKAHGVERVVVADQRQEVLDQAVEFGVRKEDCVPVGKDVVEFVNERGLLVDVVMDFVGREETFGASQQLVRPAARLVQVGLLSPTNTLSINNTLAIRKQLSILCSYGGTMPDLEACLKLIAEGKLKPQVEQKGLEDFPEVLRELHEGKIRSRMALVPGAGEYVL